VLCSNYALRVKLGAQKKRKEKRRKEKRREAFTLSCFAAMD
jgi:hypothetical protein